MSVTVLHDDKFTENQQRAYILKRTKKDNKRKQKGKKARHFH